METTENSKVPSALAKVLADLLNIENQQAETLSKELLGKYFVEILPYMASLVPDSMFIHDLEGKIIFVNEEACKSLGYTSDEIYKLKIWDIESEWEKEKMLNLWEKDIGDEHLTIYGEHRRKDGTKFPVELRIKAFDYEGNKQVLALARNISYRRSIEEKLLQSEREKSTILQNIKVPIAYKDKENRFIWINHQFSEQFGVANKDIVGKTCSEGLYNGAEVCKECPVEIALSTKEYHEVQLTTDDGRHWIVSAYPVVDDKGDILGAIELIYNITRIVEIENQLIEMNKRKDKLFSILAMDLKSTLGTALSLTDVVLDAFSHFSINDLKKFCVNMNEALRNLNRLMNNLLLWSQIQLGNYTLNPVRIDLKELVYQSLKNYKDYIKQKEITVKIDVPSLYKINTDYDFILNALSNISYNAVKYSYKKGDIEITARKNNDEEIELTFQDYGVGISEERLGKLFRIDERIATRGTNEEIGTGLGLILCKEILNIIGGSINIESQSRKGTKVTVKIKSA